MAVKVDTIQNPSSATVNLTLDTSGNVTTGANQTVTGNQTVSGNQTVTGNLTVSGTGNQSFNGNVGIGTVSPAASLSILKQTTALSGTGNSYGLYAYLTSSGLAYIDAVTGTSGNTSLGFRTYNNGTYSNMTMDQNGIVTGTAGNLMLVQGAAVASTSGTSIDYTSIPSWAKRITVMFSGMSTNGTSIPIVQIGSGSVLNTGYTASAGYAANGAASSVAAQTTGFPLSGSNSAASTYYGCCILAFISSNTWVFSWAGTQGTTTCNSGGGSVTLSGSLDRIRITTVNGTDTFDAGTINIQYE